MNSIKLALVGAFCMVYSHTTLAASNKLLVKVDSNELNISLIVFNEKMNYYIDLMREEVEFTEAEYIEMILIDNTYLLFMKNGNPIYRVQAHNQYLDFLKYYMDDILKRLEANEEGCNGGFYSSKYELCIGGTEPNEKSVYTILK